MADRQTLKATEEKILPAVSAAVAAGDSASLKRYITKALADGVPIRHLEEVILQCYLFAGFPAALEGLAVLRSTTGVAAGHLTRAPKTAPEKTVARGLRLCEKVYGDKYESLKKRSLDLHPEMWDWMIREGYGKVLSRPPLGPPLRELCVIATLVVTGWTRQLRSHVHGALNVGCKPESVLRAVKVAGRVGGHWARKWALDVARDEIAKARQTAEAGSPGLKQHGTGPRGRGRKAVRIAPNTSRPSKGPRRKPQAAARRGGRRE